MKSLNATQQNVLSILRNLPARYRHQGRAYAPIRYEVLEAFDGRTVESLVDRGYFCHTEFGLAFSAVAPDLWAPKHPLLKGPYTPLEAARMMLDVD